MPRRAYIASRAYKNLDCITYFNYNKKGYYANTYTRRWKNYDILKN